MTKRRNLEEGLELIVYNVKYCSKTHGTCLFEGNMIRNGELAQ